nr:MAG TPA: hypothetical protein [Caudoviricetes sp.]
MFEFDIKKLSHSFLKYKIKPSQTSHIYSI